MLIYTETPETGVTARIFDTKSGIIYELNYFGPEKGASVTVCIGGKEVCTYDLEAAVEFWDTIKALVGNSVNEEFIEVGRVEELE